MDCEVIERIPGANGRLLELAQGFECICMSARHTDILYVAFSRIGTAR